MQKKNSLFVMTKVKDLTNYIITVTEKSPKKFRFTLVDRMQNYCLDIIENIHIANSKIVANERLVYQEKAKVLLGLLGYVAEISYKQTCITYKQFEQISLQQAESLLYLKKWINSNVSLVSTENSVDIGD